MNDKTINIEVQIPFKMKERKKNEFFFSFLWHQFQFIIARLRSYSIIHSPLDYVLIPYKRVTIKVHQNQDECPHQNKEIRVERC